MPIYEYRCGNGHSFELFQSMSEEPVTVCVECSAPAERVLSAPAVHFKGSGFYTTDYARKGAKKAAADGGGTSEQGEKGSAEKGEKPAASKSEGSGAGSSSGGSD